MAYKKLSNSISASPCPNLPLCLSMPLISSLQYININRYKWSAGRASEREARLPLTLTTRRGALCRALPYDAMQCAPSARRGRRVFLQLWCLYTTWVDVEDPAPRSSRAAAPAVAAGHHERTATTTTTATRGRRRVAGDEEDDVCQPVGQLKQLLSCAGRRRRGALPIRPSSFASPVSGPARSRSVSLVCVSPR